MHIESAEETLPPVIVFVGPTAVGKSHLALELAGEFDADIVTADSRQVYRYMDVGTAKPSMDERARVPHHMLDLVTPDDTYSAQRFQAEGIMVLKKIRTSTRRAFVVGGTGFYIQTLLDSTTLPRVAPNPALRTRLRAEAEVHGGGALHGRLAAVDPRSASRIHPHNTSRIIRALEVVNALGGQVPAYAGGHAIPALYIGLRMPRAALHRVANHRVLSQVDAGLLQETQCLLAMGFDPASPALQGFGYREMIAHIQGLLSLDDAVDQYQISTRRYIRRQETWFRRDARIQWIDAVDGSHAARSLIRDWLARD